MSGNIRIGWEDDDATIVWTCIACGKVRRHFGCCKAGANVENERVWNDLVNEHKDCKATK